MSSWNESDTIRISSLQSNLLGAEIEFLKKVKEVKEKLSEEDFKQFCATMNMLNDFNEYQDRLKQVRNELKKELGYESPHI